MSHTLRDKYRSYQLLVPIQVTYLLPKKAAAVLKGVKTREAKGQMQKRRIALSSGEFLTFHSSKNHLLAEMSAIKAEQLQKENMMNKTVIAQRQLFITDKPQPDELW